MQQRWLAFDGPLSNHGIREQVRIDIAGPYAVRIGFRSPDAATEQKFVATVLSGTWRVRGDAGQVLASGTLEESTPGNVFVTARYELGVFSAAAQSSVEIEVLPEMDERLVAAEPYIEVSYEANAFKPYYLSALKWELASLALGASAMLSLAAAALFFWLSRRGSVG